MHGRRLLGIRWVRWLLAFLLLTFALVFLLDRFLLAGLSAWASKEISARAQAPAELRLRSLGLLGAGTAASSIRAPAWQLSWESADVTFDPAELLGGRLQRLTVTGLVIEAQPAELLRAASVTAPDGAAITPAAPLPEIPAVFEAFSALMTQFRDLPLQAVEVPQARLVLHAPDGSTESLRIDVLFQREASTWRLEARAQGTVGEISLVGQAAESAPELQAELRLAEAPASFRRLLPDLWAELQAAAPGWTLEALPLLTASILYVQGDEPSLVVLAEAQQASLSGPAVNLGALDLVLGVEARQPSLTQVRATVRLAESTFAGWTLAPVSLAADWAQGQPLRLEVPAVALSGPNEASVELALRLWLENPWQTSRETATAEGQLAVLAARSGATVVDPFRLFGQLREASLHLRASPLQVQGLPVSLHEVHLTLQQPLKPAAVSGQLKGELRNGHGPLARAELTGTRQEGRLDTQISLLTPDAQPLVSGAGGYVEATSELDLKLRSSGEALDWQPFVRLASPELETATLEGRFPWELAVSGPLDGLRAALSVQFEDLGLTTAVGEPGPTGEPATVTLTGLRGPLNLSYTDTWRSSGSQSLNIAELKTGKMQLTEGQVDFELLATDRLQVEQVRFVFLEGAVGLEPFTLNLRTLDTEFRLRFENVAAEAVMDLLPPQDFLLTGRLTGSLPLRLEDGRLFPQRGQMRLQADPPGRLYLLDKALVTSRLPQSYGSIDIRSRLEKALDVGLALRSATIDLFKPTADGTSIELNLNAFLKTPEVDLPEFVLKVPVNYPGPPEAFLETLLRYGSAFSLDGP